MRSLPSRPALLIDQVVASTSNALAVLVATLTLTTEDLNLFAIVQLVAVTVIALQRSLISEPSMALTTPTHMPNLIRPWGAILAGIAGIAALVTALSTNGNWLAIAMACSLVCPVFHDFLRYRAFQQAKYNRTLMSDIVRLGTFVLVAPFTPPNAVDLLIAWALTAVISTLFLLTISEERSSIPIFEVLRLGRYQVVDWLLATVTSTIPLFIAQLLVPVASVGAFRLAQTATGPLNTVSSFITIRYLARSSQLRSSSKVVQRSAARRTSKLVTTITISYAALTYLGFLLIGGLVFSDKTTLDQLSYALPVTLMASVVAAPALAGGALLKAIHRQKLALAPRAAILIGNLAATIAGVICFSYLQLDPLVLPVLGTALVTLIAWHLTMRRALRE